MLSQQCYSPPPPSSLVNTPNIPENFYLTILKTMEVEIYWVDKEVSAYKFDIST